MRIGGFVFMGGVSSVSFCLRGAVEAAALDYGNSSDRSVLSLSMIAAPE